MAYFTLEVYNNMPMFTSKIENMFVTINKPENIILPADFVTDADREDQIKLSLFEIINGSLYTIPT